MKHYHYEIQGFNAKAPYLNTDLNPKLSKDNFQMGDVAMLDVHASNEEEAIIKARALLKKKYYRVGKVYECHSPNYDPDLQQDMQMTQIEVQKKLLDEVKKHG